MTGRLKIHVLGTRCQNKTGSGMQTREEMDEVIFRFPVTLKMWDRCLAFEHLSIFMTPVKYSCDK